MNTEALVRQILEEQFNLEVEKIPESERKTPDFLVRDGSNEYLVEVKEKEANPDLGNAREEAFSNGEIFKVAEVLSTRSVLQNVVRDGRKQIKHYVVDDATFRIIWVHCTGVAYEARIEQIFAGLYGSETLADISSKPARILPCFYFGFSQFFKYSDSIDALIITGRQGEAQLCLNSFSPRYRQLKKSALVKAMPDGVIDPVLEEREGRAFLVDGDVNRKKPECVLDYLRYKYNIERLNVMKMRHMEVHFAIPHK